MKSKAKTRLLAITAAIILYCCPCLWAEIFSWEEGGAMHFTDDPQNIPAKKEKKVTVRPGGTEIRNWQYFNTQYSTNYYYDPASITYQRRDRYTVLIKEEYQREFYEKLVEIDCNRRMYRNGGSSTKNNSMKEREAFFRYDDFAPLDDTMKALSQVVCK